MRHFEILVGTYEEFLLGYKIDIKNEKVALVQTFADKSHSGALKCVAAHGHWIATGATDDRIFIYDMRTRKQSQILLTHDGTINALAFTPDESHLLSGGDDGSMIATRIKTWFTEGVWKKAHNGSAVTHISCHPTGKLALTLGTDLVLRTWNLVKGRVAYKTNLKSRNTLGYTPDCLAWSTGGEYFSLTGQRVIEIWSIKTADVMKSIKTNTKPICLTWINNDTCLVGLEDGKILWLNVNKETNENLIEAHNARVKALCYFDGTLVTASSAGQIKVWEVLLAENKLKELAATNIGCRPTCLNVLDLKQFGGNYVLTKSISEMQKEPAKHMLKQRTQQRGIVKIEYDNDDDNDNDSDTIDKNDEEQSDDDVEDEQDSTAKDSESEEDASSNSDANDSDNDAVDIDNEPKIQLPKSRKHKQHILNAENKTKRAKLEQQDKKKTNKHNKQKHLQQNQRENNKQNGKKRNK